MLFDNNYIIVYYSLCYIFSNTDSYEESGRASSLHALIYRDYVNGSTDSFNKLDFSSLDFLRDSIYYHIKRFPWNKPEDDEFKEKNIKLEEIKTLYNKISEFYNQKRPLETKISRLPLIMD